MRRALSAWLAHPDRRERYRRRALLGLLGASLALLAFDQGYRAFIRSHHPARHAKPGQVTVLYTTWCPYCAEVRMRLFAARMPYEAIDVEKSPANHYALQATGRRSIPTTLIGDQLLDRGVTAQISALHAHCLRTQAGTDRDCRMLDPAVQLRRVGPGPRFEAVPKVAAPGEKADGASTL
jgi:glutaredoxin